MTKETIDDYHNNLMNDWLKYMSCWSLKPEPLETPKENVEGEKNHQNIKTNQHHNIFMTVQRHNIFMTFQQISLFLHQIFLSDCECTLDL